MKYTDKTIQYPRLLAEIRAIGLDKDQYALLSESMDLSQDEIDQVLEWAEDDWQTIKDNLSGFHGWVNRREIYDSIQEEDAAPDLLEALERAENALNWFINDEGECDIEALDTARAAIAKAKGETT